MHIAPSERVEITSIHVALLTIRFVHGKDDWFLRTAQYVGDFLVCGSDPVQHIGHEDDHVSVCDGLLCLHVHTSEQIVIRARYKTASINKSKDPALPFCVGVQTVTRRAWQILDNGQTASHYPVE